MSQSSSPKKLPNSLSDLPKVGRRFGRIPCDCVAVLSFPARNAHPRVKARLVQIGRGGCALTTDERLFIGEECLIWATGGGHKYLGIHGRIVWFKTVYDDKERCIVGIEFLKPLNLDEETLSRLSARVDEIIPPDYPDDSEE